MVLATSWCEIEVEQRPRFFVAEIEDHGRLRPKATDNPAEYPPDKQ
jgi:hypothetical protein